MFSKQLLGLFFAIMAAKVFLTFEKGMRTYHYTFNIFIYRHVHVLTLVILNVVLVFIFAL